MKKIFPVSKIFNFVKEYSVLSKYSKYGSFKINEKNMQSRIQFIHVDSVEFHC